MKASKLNEVVSKVVNNALLGANWSYILTMETLIKRYQVSLWKCAQNYETRLERDPSYRKLTLSHMVSDLDKVGQPFIQNAVNIGFERGLRDLVAFGWIVTYKRPVVAPLSIYLKATQDNAVYLYNSLLPALDAQADTMDTLTTFQYRIELYSHFLWPAGMDAYKQAIADYNRYTANKKLVVGAL